MDDLDIAINKLEKLSKEFRGKRRELVEDAGELMHTTLMKNIDATVEDKTGHLRSGQKKVVGSGGGYTVVEPNYKIAPHTHLVENGHKSRGDGKYVNGKHFYLKTFVEVVPIINQKAQELIKNIAGEF